jgi:undecaprenyl-diphosphatase
MIETLNALDKQLMVLLNVDGSPYWDSSVFAYSGRLVWVPVGICFIWYLFHQGGWRRGLLTLLFIALLIFCCDQFASGLCKPYFGRLRPSHQADLAPFLHFVNGYRGSRFGFISSHASNSVGFALFMALLVRKSALSWALAVWAVLNCYTRIYLGVHFPGDILAGSLAGALFAWGAIGLYHWVDRRFGKQLSLEADSYQGHQPTAALVALGVTWAGLLVWPLIYMSFFAVGR